MKRFLLLLYTIDDKSGGTFFAFIATISFIIITVFATIYGWYDVPVIDDKIGTYIFAFFINGFFNVLYVILGGLAVGSIIFLWLKFIEFYRIIKKSIKEVYNVELESDKSKVKFN